MQYYSGRRNGFTLIELLIVIAIIAIVLVPLTGAFPIYGYLNSKEVVGVIDKVVPILEDGGIAAGPAAAQLAKSTAISIKLQNGQYFTFSSEDRQWFTLKGEKDKKCVKAKVFPYAPWNFTKAGTYFNGRLIEMADTCDKLH